MKFRYVTSSTRTSHSGSHCFGTKLMLLFLENRLITIGTCRATMSSSLHFPSSPLESSIKTCLLAFVSRYWYTSLSLSLAIKISHSSFLSFCFPQYPLLYQEGVQNVLFSWEQILGWMLNGIISSMIIFFLTINTMAAQAFRKAGQVVDYSVLGVTMYSSVVWTVNCQMAISINYFTWIQHCFIWGSIGVWYLFLVIYGSLPPTFSTTAFQVFVETSAPSPICWLTLFLVVFSALLPYFTYRAFQIKFRPMYHDIIVEQRRTERTETAPSSVPGELPVQVEFTLHHLRENLSRRDSWNWFVFYTT